MSGGDLAFPTGPQHYTMAAWMLRDIEESPEGTTDARAASAIAIAQVHATLALAAATATRSIRPLQRPGELEWGDVLT